MTAIEGVHRAVRFTLPPPREGLSASVELSDEGRPRHLLLGVAQERDYATAVPDSKPEHKVEDDFFGGRFVLADVLRRGGSIASTEMHSVPSITPGAFANALDGLLWQAMSRLNSTRSATPS